jgi:hypothetical protein
MISTEGRIRQVDPLEFLVSTIMPIGTTDCLVPNKQVSHRLDIWEKIASLLHWNDFRNHYLRLDETEIRELMDWTYRDLIKFLEIITKRESDTVLLPISVIETWQLVATHPALPKGLWAHDIMSQLSLQLSQLANNENKGSNTSHILSAKIFWVRISIKDIDPQIIARLRDSIMRFRWIVEAIDEPWFWIQHSIRLLPAKYSMERMLSLRKKVSGLNAKDIELSWVNDLQDTTLLFIRKIREEYGFKSESIKKVINILERIILSCDVLWRTDDEIPIQNKDRILEILVKALDQLSNTSLVGTER